MRKKLKSIITITAILTAAMQPLTSFAAEGETIAEAIAQYGSVKIPVIIQNNNDMNELTGILTNLTKDTYLESYKINSIEGISDIYFSAEAIDEMGETYYESLGTMSFNALNDVCLKSGEGSDIYYLRNKEQQDKGELYCDTSFIVLDANSMSKVEIMEDFRCTFSEFGKSSVPIVFNPIDLSNYGHEYMILSFEGNRLNIYSNLDK